MLDNKTTSVYVNTPINDFYLDIWEPIEIPNSTSDTLTVLEARYHERPDTLSYDIYGTPRLWWIFAMRNKDILFDPIYDFKTGIKIYIPSRTRIESLI